MRRLIAVVLVAALGWSGYWFAGSRAAERGVEAWFVEQVAAGRVAERERVEVHGFPNRFDLTVTGPRLFDPQSGYGWSAPFVQVLSLSYQPWKIIAAFPPEQVITTPVQDLTLTSAKLQASAALAPSSPLGLNRMTLVGDTLAVRSSLGWTVGAQTLRFATKTVSDDGLEHEIGLEALDVTPDPSLSAVMSDLPPTLSKVRMDVVAGFAEPVEGAPPMVSGIDVKEALIVWGDLALYGKGRVAANADGLGEGRIDFRLTNWRKILPLAVATGAISPEALPTWERALGLLAAQSGNGDDLDLPLTMQNGRMSLGPLPLGPAPRLN
jgi:hypothetical protein